MILLGYIGRIELKYAIGNDNLFIIHSNYLKFILIFFFLLLIR
jgi:hypothetical protein